VLAFSACNAARASDYQPQQQNRGAPKENEWLKQLLPAETYKNRKKNFSKWNSMTPEQKQEYRSRKLERDMEGMPEEQKRYYRERAVTTKKIKREYLPDDEDYEGDLQP
jgi:pyruvate/2-oxoacid:ferredoxin oxidoreductase alpha subunit